MNADSLEEYRYRANEPAAYPLADLRSRIDPGLVVRPIASPVRAALRRPD
jgi:hypothetical protein